MIIASVREPNYQILGPANGGRITRSIFFPLEETNWGGVLSITKIENYNDLDKELGPDQLWAHV